MSYNGYPSMCFRAICAILPTYIFFACHCMKKQPLYRRALSHALEVTWRHKALWVFGLFAATLGQMGFLEFFKHMHLFGRSAGNIPLYWGGFPVLRAILGARWHGVILPEGWVWILWLLIIGVAILATFIFVAVSSQGALIAAAAQSTLRAKLTETSTAWHVGVYHFWRLLGVHALRVIGAAGLSLAVAWSMFNALVQPEPGDLVLYLVTSVLAVVVGLILAVLTIYTAGYIVVEDYRFIPAIRAAWRLFTGHWLVSVEVGVIMVLCNLFAIFLMFFGALFFFFPAVLLWLVAVATHNVAMYTLGFLVAAVMFVLYTTILASAFTVFSTTFWTTVFMAMHRQGVKSRILLWMR